MNLKRIKIPRPKTLKCLGSEQLSVMQLTLNCYDDNTSPTERKKLSFSEEAVAQSANNCKMHLNKPFKSGKIRF